MDEKFYKRLESYKNSLKALAEAKERDMNDSFVVSGTGAKFSITFDLAWKVMKDIIIQYYAVVDFPKGSPREVLRKAFELNLIDGDVWMEMLRDRNDFTHDYDGTLVQDACRKIVDVYIDKFYEFCGRAEKFYEEKK